MSIHKLNIQKNNRFAFNMVKDKGRLDNLPVHGTAHTLPQHIWVIDLDAPIGPQGHGRRLRNEEKRRFQK